MQFEANPTTFKQISGVQISGTTRCNPAYADGALGVRERLEKTAVSQLLRVDLLK